MKSPISPSSYVNKADTYRIYVLLKPKSAGQEKICSLITVNHEKVEIQCPIRSDDCVQYLEICCGKSVAVYFGWGNVEWCWSDPVLTSFALAEGFTFIRS